MRLFLKKKWIGFQQQGMAYLAEDRYGGVRIRGVGWHGLAAGANTQMGKNIERDLEWVYASSMDVLARRSRAASAGGVDEIGLQSGRRPAPASGGPVRLEPEHVALLVAEVLHHEDRRRLDELDTGLVPHVTDVLAIHDLHAEDDRLAV